MARVIKTQVSLNAACATINKTIMNAKSLFSKKILKAICLLENFHSPFEMIEFLPEGSHRYSSAFNPQERIKSASQELQDSQPEAFKILLLALCCGLRRNETDKLLWRQVDLRNCTISIQATEYFSPKARESCNDVDIDSGLAKVLKVFKEKAKGKFVIESDVQAKPMAHYRHYRCDRIYRELVEWLRKHGIKNKNQLHALRKEYGAEICRQFGLYKTSRALRHSSYGVTENFYADKKSGVTPRFF